MATLRLIEYKDDATAEAQTVYGGKEFYSRNKRMIKAREAVLNATLFRQLEENQVIGLLSVNGSSMDDLF